ncbi:MAG: hypothetical protein ABFS16_15640 [Bacteroidota bacterium]
MKGFFVKTLALFLFFMVPAIAMACEIEFDILENKKESYQKGDVIIVNVKVIYTHRQCPEGIAATKFDYKGLKVLGATKWKETKPNTYERKFKIEIIDNSKKKLVFGAIRTCDKDGGAGSIKFNIGHDIS